MTKIARRFFTVILVAAAISAASPAIAAACFSVGVAGGNAVTVNYSPLSNADTVQDFQIQLQNISCGSVAPLVGVSNGPTDDSGVETGPRTVLSFNAQIDSGGTPVVLSVDSNQLETANAGIVANGSAIGTTWHLRIPAHSVVPYAQRDFTIYAIGAVGGSYVSTAATVHLEVAPIAQVFFAGSAPTLTVDFGELTTGEQQALAVHAQATVPFDIHWSSENAGALKLGTTSWTVPYTATFDGANVDNDTTVYSDTSSGGTDGADVALPLVVTVGDAANKRAGTYRDVVTITIVPR
jgi:hypothetical protein